VAIHLCGSPGSVRGRAALSLLNLAPDGVCRAGPVARVAGALLPHRFTLTCATRRWPSAVCSLWHFPAGHPGWPLASILPCGAPTFLSPFGEPNEPRPPGRLTVAVSMACPSQRAASQRQSNSSLPIPVAIWFIAFSKGASISSNSNP
jgi:hypothetical protein